MKPVRRLLANICSNNLPESRDFYTSLFDFESDWFIHLISRDSKLELGIIDQNNELVPPEFRNKPDGYYLTMVVDSVDDIFELAKTEGYDIIQNPHDTFYGQRRLLIKDPNGTLIDVSSPIPDFNF